MARNFNSFGFYRYPKKAHVLGVCAGLAERLEFDVNIVRAAAFFGIVFSGMIPGLIVYGLIGLILPPRSRVLGDDGEASSFSPRSRWEDRKREKEAIKAERQKANQNAKSGKKGGIGTPETDRDSQVAYQVLKRRFQDMETRTRLMEKEITSSRFKLERELKSLES